jgi:hypothetical protein
MINIDLNIKLLFLWISWETICLINFRFGKFFLDDKFIFLQLI